MAHDDGAAAGLMTPELATHLAAGMVLFGEPDRTLGELSAGYAVAAEALGFEPSPIRDARQVDHPRACSP